MIKCEKGEISIKGDSKEVLSEFTLVVSALRKSGIPSELIAHSIGLGITIAYIDDGEDELDELEMCESAEKRNLEELKETFRFMDDESRAEIVRIMREVIEEDD